MRKDEQRELTRLCGVVNMKNATDSSVMHSQNNVLCCAHYKAITDVGAGATSSAWTGHDESKGEKEIYITL